MHPLGLGDSDDAAGALWSVLGEGKRSMVAKHDPEVIDEAIRLIQASGGRNYADEDLGAVPFSTEFEDKHPRGQPENKGEFARKGTTFVSPNRSTGTTFIDAVRMAQSNETKESRLHVAAVTAEIADTTATHQGIGSWKDGAEPTFIFQLSGIRDFHELKYVAAWQGLLLEQKATLAFLHDSEHGKNLLWSASIPGTIKEVEASLNDSRLAMTPRTISQRSQG